MQYLFCKVIFRSALKVLSITAVALTLLPDNVNAQSGDCSNPALAGRTDLILCETFSSSDWWTREWVDSARGELCEPGSAGCPDNGLPDGPGSSTLVPSAIGYTRVVSQTTSGQPCVRGNCLRVYMLAGSHGNLSAEWRVEDHADQAWLDQNGNEELYMSYYIHMSPNWNSFGTNGSAGGKFPGFADERIYSDPVGQCGTGSEFADGINCWSMRTNFYPCSAGGVDKCIESGVSGAETRIGGYLYTLDQGLHVSSGGIPLHFDDNSWNQFPASPYCDSSDKDNWYCGIGTAGMLRPNQWYHVELYAKMNTPGVPDGVIRGWVDGVLAYDKRNVLFRNPGHDDLQIKSIWLGVFMGGSGSNLHDQEVHIDELVIATEAPVSRPPGPRPNPPVLDSSN